MHCRPPKTLKQKRPSHLDQLYSPTHPLDPSPQTPNPLTNPVRLMDPEVQGLNLALHFQPLLKPVTENWLIPLPAEMPTAFNKLLVVRLMDSQPVIWAGTVASW